MASTSGARHGGGAPGCRVARPMHGGMGSGASAAATAAGAAAAAVVVVGVARGHVALSLRLTKPLASGSAGKTYDDTLVDLQPDPDDAKLRSEAAMSPSRMLRPAAAAAARAIRRCYHADGAPPRKLRGPRFSPFSRHNHEVNALLEEVKNTPVNMITDDLMIRTVRHSILARQEILVQNILRSWVVVAAVFTGYSWGYNRVAESSTVGSETPKEHEEKY